MRFISEQDSLNASVLGPDATPDTPEFDLFVKEALREMTVKAGQKCTAIRRIIAPEPFVTPLIEAAGDEKSRDHEKHRNRRPAKRPADNIVKRFGGTDAECDRIGMGHKNRTGGDHPDEIQVVVSSRTDLRKPNTDH